MLIYEITLYLHTPLIEEEWVFEMKTSLTKTRSAKVIQELVPKTTPTTLLGHMNKCYNCGVNMVHEIGDWCWECIKDRESLD
jgi:hypothetical protein